MRRLVIPILAEIRALDQCISTLFNSSTCVHKKTSIHTVYNSVYNLYMCKNLTSVITMILTLSNAKFSEKVYFISYEWYAAVVNKWGIKLVLWSLNHLTVANYCNGRTPMPTVKQLDRKQEHLL